MRVHNVIARVYVSIGISVVFFIEYNVDQLLLAFFFKLFHVFYKLLITFLIVEIEFKFIEELSRVVEAVVH